MRIENTELDYQEHESVGLDRYLCTNTETKDAWAQRIWDCCRRQSEGEDLARVYKTKPEQTWQERAQELWDNKKKRRCIAVCFEFKENEVSTESLLRIKNDPKYKTAQQMHDEKQQVR